MKTDKGSTFESHHWFDGLTTVHRFEIRNDGSTTKVLYNSRRTVDELIQHIRKTGEFKDFSFAQKRDPCEGMFKKVMSTFKSTILASSNATPTAQNVGVTITANMPGIGQNGGSHGTRIESLITKTDANLYQRLDPETLEPMGLCRQTVLHPDLKGPLSAAHAKTCPMSGDIYNYNLDFGPKTLYRIWCASASTGKATILATIPSTGAYLHSLFLTPSTVILCVWNSHYSARGMSLLLNRNVLDSIAPMDPSLDAIWYVIDRTPSKRGLIAAYTSPAFFAFHTVNAFEVPSPTNPSTTDIVAEVTTYEDLSILHRFYYRNLLPPAPSEPSFTSTHPQCIPRLTRYRLPSLPLSSASPHVKADAKTLRPAQIDSCNPPELSCELPAMNPRFSTLPHRYTYGIRDTGKSGFFDGLMKVDAEKRQVLEWSEHAQTAGEPIFVPRPREEGGEEEDDGVLLSVVLDGVKGSSYLLCLDARTMTEVGRASVNGVVGFGFHGLHVPEKKGEVYAGGD